MRRLPGRRARALDVGCGRGGLAARLAREFSSVDAADSDASMRAATAERCAGLDVRVIDGFDAAAGSYDVITMIASLHHLDLDATLRRCHELLAPGGRLLVAGLVRPESARDYAWFAICAATNPVIGFAKHPRPCRGPAPAVLFPVRDPDESYAQIRQTARGLLPGARMHRRLGFRYTLEWHRP
ncbi:class I SAM-dependent methyltransferase [Tsukamurella sp. 8F]|uniref:class I SAM-dependent methyltransferase n=1 Tax=Tsukamurella sp. 8J TaxID=3031962 RepID=UPI0023B8C372|nr:MULTISPECIES: class I SAM-dependent methyltransferase [unclassified Tsukamurella]MDF0529936.1 class I SAM-dependent methyltransferase [Tsukamurella sp. 8J]MDF0587292.1 class I SAM-dependent methyltransferase [Tsukamurella sp. 8F]